MNETNKADMWQIEVGGQIYEADFDEMTRWIFEGSLLRQDKVRRGNLRWIEAEKVPALVKFFNAQANGEPPPAAVMTTDAGTSHAGGQYETAANFQTSAENGASQNPFVQTPAGAFSSSYVAEHSGNSAPPDLANASGQNFANQPGNEKTAAEPSAAPKSTAQFDAGRIADVCSLHEELESAYFCATCGHSFCRECPKSYGGAVKICPFCGAMCKSIARMREDLRVQTQFQTASREGFGLKDFGRAFGHPFKFGASLAFGAVMFTFFSFGQSAAYLGGIILIASALLCYMLANMLSFGILSNTIDNFSQGRLNSDFMPSFENFSMWDDVVHPFFLSIGTHLVAFGPFLLACVAMGYFAYSSAAAQNSEMQKQVDRIPGTTAYDTTRTFQQSEQVKKLLVEVRRENAERLKVQERLGLATGTPAPLPESTPSEEEMRKVQTKISEERNRRQIARLDPNYNPDEEQAREVMQGMFNISPLVFIVVFATLLWALFYLPAACAVAGYTRSFAAVMNPSVGFDTIKRLGVDYFKILGMFLLIGLGFGLINLVLTFLLSQFNLPYVGNVPVKIITSFILFYLTIVFSCILGYAIYKNSDKFNIYRC